MLLKRSESRLTETLNMQLTSLPCAMLVVGVLPGWLDSAAAADAVLPGTDPLLIQRPLDEVMIEGLNRFCRRELAASRQQRAARWEQEFSSVQAGAEGILRRRQRFQALIGAADPRATAGAAGRQRFELVSVDQWEQSRPRLRDWVHDELIGRLTAERLPPRPRSRRVLDTGEYTGYKIVLDVCEDIIAAGILLLPNNLAAGEERPLVVCQHGLEGTPWDTISRQPQAYASYKAFSEELVKQGFLVYARNSSSSMAPTRSTARALSASSAVFYRCPSKTCKRQDLTARC